MSEDTPPRETGSAPAEPSQPTAAWRWIIYLLMLGLYPIVLGGVAAAQQHGPSAPLLSVTAPLLVLSLLMEMALFATLFLLAWMLTKPRAAQLYFRREPLGVLLGQGFLFSVGLRLLLGILTLILAGFLLIIFGPDSDWLNQIRPRTEMVVTPGALVDNPLYLWINLTLVSFLMGGFREELWRVAMFAGFQSLRPKLTASWKGKTIMVSGVALLFGLGHIPQGPGGVLLTTLLGIGLGILIVWRRSFWQAALAHGFFDATSFAALYVIARFFPEGLPK